MAKQLGVRHRYVFVCGLHRTGTSLVARLLGQHPSVASISGAPVPENEGCYLQGAIPHTARHGIPGHFATDPEQHLTESHPLNSLDTKERLEREWGDWFDPDLPWRVEKSPVNLTRMRLLQGLFPLSQFIVVTRHPAYMAQALLKWSEASADALAQYGVASYERMLSDLEYLHSVMVVRYEDLVHDAPRAMTAIEAFLDLEPQVTPDDIRNGNSEYLLPDSAGGGLPELGYDDRGALKPIAPVVRHPLRSIREKCETLL